jgi:biopolymer transport protein ExbD
MAIRARNKVEPGYSVAGMTDIIFLLLIFFVLTSTLVSPNALNVQLPQSNSQVSAKPLTSVSVTKDLQFYVESTPVTQAQLETEIVNRLQYREDPTLAIHIDRTVPVEYLVIVMNIAKNHNYRVIMATSPEN